MRRSGNAYLPRCWFAGAACLALALPLSATAEDGGHGMGEGRFGLFQLERLEYQYGDDEDAMAWEAGGWYGGDYNKLWFKTEGEKPEGASVEEAEFQLLYSRLFPPFFDWQAGVRYDVKPEPERAYAVLGLQVLAPYLFEVDAAAFLSEEGDLTGRAEAEYELLFTQRLILQPSLELNFAAQEVEELGIGSGLTDAEVGLRLRYEIVREFAPYVGVSWERKAGDTADLARAEGEDVEDLRWVAGVRVWF